MRSSVLSAFAIVAAALGANATNIPSTVTLSTTYRPGPTDFPSSVAISTTYRPSPIGISTTYRSQPLPSGTSAPSSCIVLITSSVVAVPASSTPNIAVQPSVTSRAQQENWGSTAVAISSSPATFVADGTTTIYATIYSSSLGPVTVYPTAYPSVSALPICGGGSPTSVNGNGGASSSLAATASGTTLAQNLDSDNQTGAATSVKAAFASVALSVIAGLGLAAVL
ncbi:hypothetical protein NLJ89_g10039 [Agrocybe chaxingu]|uniref:Uncharacterized protein n=1 Tax=Agrocybe chaxingu TaxID=84603 RepID=A0A9W8JS34_9AGAR|nr:hypothetical protein NLJ89_g10039 [Agrocybe chaxingu]